MIGASENKRNMDNHELFEAIVKEAYGDVEWVGCKHHIMYKRRSEPVPESIASADTLIFDHEIAKVIWGSNWSSVLSILAMEPAEHRDVVLGVLYRDRKGG